MIGERRADVDKEWIIAPDQQGTVARAEDILDEIQQVLKKHNCSIVHTPDCVAIAHNIDPLADKAFVIASVQFVTPFAIRWRKRTYRPRG
jgi:hypothetical protein